MTTEWKPTNTPPEDGSVVLLWGGWINEYPLVGSYSEVIGWMADTSQTGAEAVIPTHWMNLPEPPK